MFLRSKRRLKNGKWHRYWSVVENRRLAADRVVQRQVLYLGEIHDDQESAWRKTLEVFDEQRHETCPMSLFPEDRPIPADAVNALSLRMTDLRLRRARGFGDCWLGLTLWRECQLDRFWAACLAGQRGDVPWARVLAILAINRLVAPASEWHVHREWFLRTALDELLGVDFAAVGKDRLYRCLDRLVAHKDALHRHLVDQMQLVQVEQAFEHFKTDLAIRPIEHQTQVRVEAHILVAFLGYALLASLQMKLRPAAPGLTPRAVLEKLASIRMVDVCIPTTDGRLLVMPRHIEPEADQQLVLDKLNLRLPPQPPPRIRGGEVILPAAPASCSADL